MQQCSACFIKPSLPLCGNPLPLSEELREGGLHVPFREGEPFKFFFVVESGFMCFQKLEKSSGWVSQRLVILPMKLTVT